MNDALRILPSLILEQTAEQGTPSIPSHTATSKEYSLVSIMMHSGSAHSGHYFAYIKSQMQTGAARWLLFNDSDVTVVSEEQLAVVLGSDAPPSAAVSETPSASTATPTLPSANNAYMLVYREVSPVNLWEQGPTNAQALADDDTIPASLRAAVHRENQLYCEQKAKYDYERAFLHISVSPVVMGGYAQECAKRLAEGREGTPSAKKDGEASLDRQNRVIRIHEGQTLQALTDMVYENFRRPHEAAQPASGTTPADSTSALPPLIPSDLPRDCVRLRAFDSIKGTALPPSALLPPDMALSIDHASEGDTPYQQQQVEARTVLKALSDTTLRRVMHLEIRSPTSAPFSEGSAQEGILVTLEVVPYVQELSGVFGEPVSFQFPSGSTVQAMLHLLYRQMAPATDGSSAANVCNFEDMIVAIHDISSGVARQVHPRPASSRVDYQSALATSLVCAGNRVYVDLHLSLSAPPLPPAAPANAANNGAAGHVNVMDYFHTLENTITIYFPDIGRGGTEGAGARLDISVDRRWSLAEVKQRMAQKLDRCIDSFVMLRGGKSETDSVEEIKNLSLSLAQNGYDDGSFMLLRAGTPLLPGEFRVQFLRRSSVCAATSGITSSGEFSLLGEACVLRGDQTVRDIKRWLISNRLSVAEGESPPNLRLQLASKHAGESSVTQTLTEGGHSSDASEDYFKPTFVLDDQKTLKECLGSQLKDGLHVAVTIGVKEASFSSTQDLFVSLWRWSPVARAVCFYGDVVISKSETFGDLKSCVMQLCLQQPQPVMDDDDYDRHLAAGNIYFAKPFTWQLKDAAANIPLLKWSSQPEHDGVLVTGPPFRLSNAPLAGPALLVFKVCAPSALLEVGDESSASADRPAEVYHEVGFRIYSMEEQASRQAEEAKLANERKHVIEERLKTMCKIDGLHLQH